MRQQSIKGRFNRACREILEQNDQCPDPEVRSRVRAATLSSIQDLRRWVEEAFAGEIQTDDDQWPEPDNGDETVSSRYESDSGDRSR